MFRHPNYYKNLRKLARNRDPHVRPISGSADSATDQVISPRAETSGTGVHPDPGPKQQAASDKPQASASTKPQAASSKPCGARVKPQATSVKLLD